MNLVFIPFLKMCDFSSALLGLLDLLPRLHLLLFQQSDAVRKQLCVSLNPIKIISYSRYSLRLFFTSASDSPLGPRPDAPAGSWELTRYCCCSPSLYVRCISSIFSICINICILDRYKHDCASLVSWWNLRSYVKKITLKIKSEFKFK